MIKVASKVLRFPFYPWVVGAYPVLYLYSVNFGLVIDREVAICLFWVLAAITIGYLAAYVVKRNYHMPALIATVVSISFSISGHLHSLISERVPILVWTLTVSIVVAIAVAKMLRIRKHNSAAQLALPLNLISLTMILIQFATLFTLFSDINNNPVPDSMLNGMSPQQESSPKVNDSSTRPDVYFIVPDAYPSDAWLQSAMDYDNSAFTEALKARGFVIASQAQSNYASTLPSLASILNMRHFNANPANNNDEDHLRFKISNNYVARYLKQQGYAYVQFLSGHLFPSPLADINRDFAPGGPVDITIEHKDITAAIQDAAQNSLRNLEVRRFTQHSFLSLYIDTTLLKVFDKVWPYHMQGGHSWSYYLYSPHRFLDTIDEISSIVAMPEATFTLVHLLKPHRPVTFDAKGNIIEMNKKPNRNEHIAEFEFIKTKFIEMIDTILEGSQHEPVIIFQADHGSTNGKVKGSDYRLIHFDVYSAFYLPDRYSLEIPQPFTTINTFPLILNAVFDAGLEFSDNRLYEQLPTSQRVDVTKSFANWLN